MRTTLLQSMLIILFPVNQVCCIFFADIMGEVAIYLKPVKQKWYSLGHELRVAHAQLKAMEDKYLKDSDRLLLEVLHCWLRDYVGDDYIQTLSDALDAMEEDGLAFHLRSQCGIPPKSSTYVCRKCIMYRVRGGECCRG